MTEFQMNGEICPLVIGNAERNPEGWDVKNLGYFKNMFVHISLNPYFLEAPLVARISSKFFPYSLINNGIRAKFGGHIYLLRALIGNKGNRKRTCF